MKAPTMIKMNESSQQRYKRPTGIVASQSKKLIAFLNWRKRIECVAFCRFYRVDVRIE